MGAIGSDPHGSRGRNVFERVADEGRRGILSGTADGADQIGLDNAARHMGHYLGNSGATLDVDPAAITRDVPQFEAEVQEAVAFDLKGQIDRHIADVYDGGSMTFVTTTGWQRFYATKDVNQD